MKQKLLFLTLFLLAGLGMHAQKYNNSDKEGLRAFLRQKDRENKDVKEFNYVQMGLTSKDTLSWHTSEAWIEKIKQSIKTNAAGRITELSFSNKGLSGDLECLYFTELETLLCDNNYINSINVSKNPKLKNLYCESNKITRLDVSQNTNLVILACSFNQITELDMSGNNLLSELYCDNNELISLNLLNNPNLWILSCFQNGLGTLDLSKNINLQKINVSKNRLKSLSIPTTHTKLKEIDCSENYLEFSAIAPFKTRYVLNYAPQRPIYRDIVPNGIIDLDKERSIYGYTSVFSWYDSEGNRIYPTSAGVGKYRIDAKYTGQRITGKLTNSYLPNFILEYTVNVTNEDLTGGYNVSDKESLRKFLRQEGMIKLSGIKAYNFQVANLEPADTLAWGANEEWINKIKYDNKAILTWNTIGGNKRLTKIFANGGGVKVYGFSGHFDASGFDNLTTIGLLTHNLKSIDVSKVNELAELSLSNNSLSTIDVSKNVNLIILSLSGNNFSNIDISKNINLRKLSIKNNKLTSIDLSNNTDLSIVEISGNQFRISTLPILNNETIARYRYAPQDTIRGGEVPYYDIMDLSAEYQRGTEVTKYVWKDEYQRIVSLSEIEPGMFLAGKRHIGKTLICEMVNPLFPELTLVYTVYITEGGEPVLTTDKVITSNLQINIPNKARGVHQVSALEQFKVAAKIGPVSDEVQIGLFRKNGEEESFIAKISESIVKVGIYNCKIPALVPAGEYIIQPYVLVNGRIIPVERRPGEFIIDKLPLTVAGARAFKEKPISEIVLDKEFSLVLPTPSKYSLAKGEEFKAIAPQTSMKTKIGIFNSNGDLRYDVVVGRNGNIFDCKIPVDAIVDNNYIIAPYEEYTFNIIERDFGAHYIDKLPLIITSVKTQNFSLEKEIQASLYPNPVSDVLYITTDEVIKEVIIYTTENNPVYQSNKVTESGINVSWLSPGVYIVSITTSQGVKNIKMIKI